MIVVIEGIDGAGKTTVAALVAETLRSHGLTAHVLKNSRAEFEDAFAQEQMAKLRDVIWSDSAREPDRDVMGTRFYLFSIAAWYAGLQRHRIAQLKQVREIYILDGWYYRTIAKAFIRQGLNKAWLWSLFDATDPPDLVVLLDIPPAVAWTRRQDFKPSEIGRWDGFDGDSYDAYCRYQGRVKEELLLMAREHGWFVVDQTAQSSVADSAVTIAGRVLRDFEAPSRRLSSRV